MKRFCKKLLHHLGYRISRYDNIDFFQFEALLYYQLKRSSDFQFIQIGACDGVSFDPIYPFVTKNHRRLRGVTLEPLPDLFEKLKKAYQRYPSITPVNLAIHNSEREMTLHRVDPAKLSQLPEFAIGLASFDADHHARSGVGKECLKAEIVTCCTLTEIVEQYDLGNLDLLQIDAEGYDIEILLGLDFERIKPAIIRFEHNMSAGATSADRMLEIVEHLHNHGYELAFLDSDAVAYLRDLTWKVS